MQKIYEQFPTDAWGKPCPAVTFKPDVMPAGKKFPLILFLHGWGEAAAYGPIDAVLKFGPPKYMNQGFNLDAILVCPQAPDFSYQFGAIRFILAEVFKRYPIDMGSIHGTGISAGGGGIWSAVTNPGIDYPNAPTVATNQIKKLFSTIVPLSSMYVPQGYEDPFVNYVASEAEVAVWSIAGTKDVKYSEQKTYIDRLKANNPLKLPIELTGIAGQDHTPGAWDTASDPNWKGGPWNTNIYNFMLSNAKSLRTTVPDPPAPPVPTKTIVKEFTFTKTTILQLWNDGSVTEK